MRMGDKERRIAELLDDIRTSVSKSDSHSPEVQSCQAGSDASFNPYASPRSPTDFQRPVVRAYADVPWYRRSAVNTLFSFVGLTIFPPLVWWTCFNLITGDVYYNAEHDGRLMTWSKPNKFVAALLLFFHAAMIVNIATYLIGRGRF
jgi:hypothetical protein